MATTGARGLSLFVSSPTTSRTPNNNVKHSGKRKDTVSKT